MAEDRRRGNVIGIPIDALSWQGAQARLMAWARARESRSVCICNVHSVVTATQDAAFRTVIQEADMATPDGAPVAWTLRRKGFAAQERINGPDLMWRLCEQAAREGVPIGLYGATQPVLDLLGDILRKAFPGLDIAYSVSPPFRALSAEEDAQVCADINRSGAGLLFVGLGCPKQEKWIAQHRGRVDAVMLGVGAAFDYHAGTLKRAPEWMRASGLEWLHRVSTEPRRLWRRYLVTNSIFIATSVSEWFRGGFARR
jgi:N-acetylglucosaminyldiphosphoundecaprenol N-acetyl-beta-D-mannosaminyltransferase